MLPVYLYRCTVTTVTCTCMIDAAAEMVNETIDIDKKAKSRRRKVRICNEADEAAASEGVPVDCKKRRRKKKKHTNTGDSQQVSRYTTLANCSLNGRIQYKTLSLSLAQIALPLLFSYHLYIDLPTCLVLENLIGLTFILLLLPSDV